MEILQIDSARCTGCGACARDCAFGALKRGEDGRPVMAHPERCMRCQHCFAICPTGALAFDGRDAKDALPTRGLALPTAEEVLNWMHVRRSTRRFRDEDVDRAALARVLTALGSTPTGCNARSLTFTCYPDRASMARFRQAFISCIEHHRDGAKLLPRWLAVPAIKLRRGGEDVFFRGASGMLIVSSDETAPGVTTPHEDVIAALTYFEMLAHAHGIATCWCGFLRLVQQEVPELLEATVGIRRTTPFYAMLFGRSALNYPRGVLRDDYARIVYK
ncbi:MAG: nitroreductase family protein [Kiritimatiellia bacterium]